MASRRPGGAAGEETRIRQRRPRPGRAAPAILAARLTAARASPAAGPRSTGPLDARGGLVSGAGVDDPIPCMQSYISHLLVL